MDRFEDMSAFVAVVEAGSFTAAADRLDVARSVVSRRVAALEERLGVQLLRRTTRRINLTDTGRGFYERSAALLADLEEAESAVAQQHGELRGQLKLALPLSFGIRHMLDPLADFSKQHPRVSFELDFNDRRVDLLQEGVDLALRIGRLSDSNLIARKLFDARTVICASPGFVKEYGLPEHPDELTQLPCLVYSNLAEPDRWQCRDANDGPIDVRVRVAMRASSGDFLCGAAAQGLGIVMQPTFIASDLIRSGALVPLLTGFHWPVSPAYAVYPPTRHLSYRVRELIDFLASRFEGQPPWDRACAVC
ncbi:MAG: LysR family transcriptional regulator [Pseudomonadota bacterium]